MAGTAGRKEGRKEGREGAFEKSSQAVLRLARYLIVTTTAIAVFNVVKRVLKGNS